MLGNEQTSVRGNKLRVGDHVISHDMVAYGDTIAQIEPAEDPWVTEPLFGITLESGSYFRAFGDDRVSVVIDVRERR